MDMKTYLTEQSIPKFMELRHTMEWKSNKRWIYDEPNVQRQMFEWERQLSWIKPYYALKSNPSLELIKTLIKGRIGIDAASVQELRLAKKFANDIIYTNPHTILHEKDALADLLPYCSLKVVDTLFELKQFVDVELLIRMNSCHYDADVPFDTKFGCTRSEAYEMIDYAKQNHMVVRGVSFHIGSGGQHNRREAYCKAYAYAKPVLEYLYNVFTHPPILDIGGGLLHDTPLSDTLGWTQYIPYDIIAEPGRYFSSPAYHMLCQVISTSTRGVFLDNGVYHELNVIHRDHWTMPILTHYYDHDTGQIVAVEPSETETTLFGPTCDSYDTIIARSFPRVEPGDWIFLENMGAYTSVGNCNFNGIFGASFISP
jgi:ornithine decarboxylase